MVPVRSKGLCPSCRAKDTALKNKNMMVAKKPKAVSKKGKKVDPDLSGFFISMLEKLSDSRISYTGKPIYFPTVCNVCHILPKRYYKSVAKEELNIIFLTDEEHTRFDHLLDCMDFDKLEEEFPVVWRRSLNQIKKMEDMGLIKEKGKLINNIEERCERKDRLSAGDGVQSYD